MKKSVQLLAVGAALWCTWAAPPVAAQARALPARDVKAIYQQLLPRIEQIRLFDNHSHPGFPDDPDVDAMASPPGSQALRTRADNPELIAAARALFQYPYRDSAPGHSEWLVKKKAPEAVRPGEFVSPAGEVLGAHEGHQHFTIGQRRGLGLPGGTAPRYVVDVDVEAARVVVGERADLSVSEQPVEGLQWSSSAVTGPLVVQCSAHGQAQPATIDERGDGRAIVRWARPQRRIAPGQSVVAYEGDEVVAGATASAGSVSAAG